MFLLYTTNIYIFSCVINGIFELQYLHHASPIRYWVGWRKYIL